MADTEIPPYDPEWLEVEAKMGGRTIWTLGDIAAGRRDMKAAFTAMAAQGPDLSAQVDESIVWMTPSRYIKVYKPKDAWAAAQRECRKLPVGLYIHAGGFACGEVELEDGLCRRIALGSGVVLFSPDYRLAPEEKFPAGHNDVCDAYEWMHHHAEEFGGDATRKAVMGGSAGGTLAGTVAVNFSADPVLRPKAVVMACASCCEPDVMPEKYRKRLTPEFYADCPMITDDSLTQVREWLGAPPSDPLYSTLLHPNLKHIAHAYLIACEKDPTTPETRFFYEELQAHGVDAEYEEWKGMPHFFWALPSMKKSQECMDRWCSKLTEMLEKP